MKASTLFTAPRGRPRRFTQGASLIVVVLFTLLILSMVIAATLRLSLSTRLGSTDQKTTLQAQYSAESNLTLVRSRLQDIQNVLTAESGGTLTGYLGFPSGTNDDDVNNWALLFCDPTGKSTWSTEANNTLGKDTTTPTQICANSNNSVAAESYTILGNLVTSLGYATLPSADKPPTTTSASTNTTWWFNYLNNNKTSSGTNFSVIPEKVLKNGYTYRFYFKPYNISAKTTNMSNGVRAITAQGEDNSDWWIEIKVQNLFDRALALDRWLSDDGGFASDIIKGNLFTNEKLRFVNSPTTQFLGNVETAGCTNLKNSQPATGQDCDPSVKSAGYYIPYDGSGRILDNSIASSVANATLKKELTNNNIKFTAGKVVNFRAKYIPLPLKASKQKEDAAKAGISVPTSVVGIKLYAGDNNQNVLNSYNANTSSWNESTSTYQYIELYDSKGKLVSTYRQDSNGNFSQKTPPSTSWSPIANSFNGVIYSDHPISVDGPPRTSTSAPGDVSKMPPALASFSQINVTSEGNITLNTDLTSSNTPCGYDNTWYNPNKSTSGSVPQPGCPKQPVPKNVLALFSTAGNITMSTSTSNEATYHAAILSGKGTFDVANILTGTRSVQGKRHVVGAVVESHYGVNGVSNGTRLTKGYTDDFSQDVRLKDVKAIPSNPITSIQTWEYHNAKTDPTDTDYKSLDNLIWKQDTQ